jgi:hypothetical protein
MKREREKEKARERKRKRKKKRNRKRKRKGKRKIKRKKFVTIFSFFSRPQDQLWQKFAAVVNPENKPTKVNWALSWSSALEICGKVVL